MQSLISFFKLIRLPNIFTAISNVCAGAVIVNGGIFPIPDIFFVIIASAFLYGGGIAINDYSDRGFDREFRPERPIPSGGISEREALLIGVSLLIIGIISGFIISKNAGFIAVAIAISAVLYDSFLKKWFLPGIISMGLCRGLNWSLGLETGKGILDFIPIPIAIFIYIVILTAVSRYEVKKSGLKKIVAAGIILLPIIDGFIVLSYGYIWQGLLVSLLIVPTILFSKIFDMT